MLPQPLPSGAPLSSAPPPPPPPRLSTAAFSSAAAAAARIPPACRRPTLHIAVVLGTATVPLLRHAHALLRTLAAKGVHVFLQTEVEVPPPRNIAPITNDTIPDVVAASRADFFVVIADRDLPNRSAQVRLSPAADFVTLPVAELPDAVFDAWRLRIRAHRDPVGTVALAMNPNVVTETHLDRLLRACADIPHLRRTYAALLRLVNITHDWEHQADNLPPQQLLLPAENTHESPVAPEENESASGEGQDAQEQRYIREGEGDNAPEKSDTQVSTEASAKRAGKQATEQKTGESDYDNTSLEEPVTIPDCDEPCDEAFRALVEHALHEGIKAILRAHQQKDQRRATKPRSNQRSDLSSTWLRRSDDVAARLVRSQLLARSLHQRLLSAFDTIASLPVSPISSPREIITPTHLPSHAHRERLLREINDLLPRVEEVGTRLSKRPKTRRRRKRFLESNPWSIYQRRAQAAAAQGKGRRQDVAGCIGDAARRSVGETWRCYACLSFNKVHAAECTACQSPCCVTELQGFMGNAELLKKRFEDALKTLQGAPTPWVFAPGVLPVQPLLSNGYPNGAPPAESLRRSTRARSPQRKEDRSLHAQEIRQSSVALREANGVQLRQSFDIGGRFHTALSFDDQHTPIRSDSAPVAPGSGAHGVSRVPIPERSKRSSAMRPAQVPPVRLATSAPNGPSIMDLDFSRVLSNSMRPRDGELRSSAPVLRGSHSMKSSLDDHKLTSRLNHSAHVGSLPVSEAFPTPLPYGIPPGKDAKARDFYPTSLDTERRKQSSSVRVGQSQAKHQSIPKPTFPNPGLQELAKGSYEAVEDGQMFPSVGRRVASKAAVIPGSKSNGEPLQNEITSLEALAAASDAANGGTGSATKESLRAVSAVVTSGRGRSGPKSDDPPNGMYNMF